MKKYSLGIFCALVVMAGIGGTAAALSSTQIPDVPAPTAGNSSEALPGNAVVNESEETDAKTDTVQLFYANGFTNEDMRDRSKTGRSAGALAQSKEEIYDRMLNTADFYQTLTGQYCRTQTGTGTQYTVEYFVQNGDTANTVEVYQAENGSAAQVSYYNGNVIRRMEIANYKPQAKGAEPIASDNVKSVATYFQNRADITLLDFVPLVRADSRIQTDETGVNTYYYRQNVNGLFYSRESLDPQEMAFGFLEDRSRWEITGQETIAGRECLLLEGTLTGDYAEKLQAYSYRLYVDAQTGIVLQYENFDKNGALTDKLETASITVDQPISEETFHSYGGQYAAVLQS